MQTLVNLTPHDCHLVAADGSITTIPKGDGPAPRLADVVVRTDMTIAGVPVVRKRLSAEGCVLPDAVDGVGYLVPLAIAQAFPGREDLLVPDDLVRKDGVIIGCGRLAQIGD